MQNLCKRVCIWKYMYLGKFSQVLWFLWTFVYKRSYKLYFLGVKLLHDYLFRVEKGKKKRYLFKVSNPTAILVRDKNFTPAIKCLGCFLWVHGRAWYPLLPFDSPPPLCMYTQEGPLTFSIILACIVYVYIWLFRNRYLFSFQALFLNNVCSILIAMFCFIVYEINIQINKFHKNKKF